MKSWYTIKAQSENEFEVIIYDEIGFWGMTAKDFITDFKKIDPLATINLRINSPGGDVFDGEQEPLKNSGEYARVRE